MINDTMESCITTHYTKKTAKIELKCYNFASKLVKSAVLDSSLSAKTEVKNRSLT